MKLYYGTIVTKTAYYWHKNGQEDQWNSTEDPEINPHSYSDVILDKSAKTMYGRKDSLSTYGARKTVHLPHVKDWN
jgi:hypothetical protein